MCVDKKTLIPNTLALTVIDDTHINKISSGTYMYICNCLTNSQIEGLSYIKFRITKADRMTGTMKSRSDPTFQC